MGFLMETLVAMNFNDELFSHIIKAAKQLRIGSKAAIGTNTMMAQTLAAGLLDKLQSQFALGAEEALLLRHASFFTTRRLIAPSLWQVKSGADGQGVGPCAETGENRRLAIVNLAGVPVILAGHPDGMSAFFGEIGAIKDQDGVRRTPGETVCLPGNFSDERFRRPWGIAD